MLREKVREKGQVMIMFAVVLLLFCLPVWAYATSQGQEQIWYARASDAALMGARAGASDINLSALQGSGVFKLSNSSATVCGQNINQTLKPPAGGTISVNCQTNLTTNTEMATVTMTIPFIIAFPGGIGQGHITATESASLQHGCNSPLNGNGYTLAGC